MSELRPESNPKETPLSESVNKSTNRQRLDQQYPGLFEMPVVVARITEEGQPATDIRVIVREALMLPSHMAGESYPFSGDEELSSAALYLGPEPFADASEVPYTVDPDLGNERSIAVYNDALLAMQAIRHYVHTKELVAYSALVDTTEVADRKDVIYGPVMAEALAGSPYAPKERKVPLMQRLLSKKARAERAFDVVDGIKRDGTEDELSLLANELTEARAWYDIKIADMSNMMAIDTLSAITRYQKAMPGRKTRELDKLQTGLSQTARNYIKDPAKANNVLFDINHVDQGLKEFSHLMQHVVNPKNLSDVLMERVTAVRQAQLAAIALRSAAMSQLFGEGMPAQLDYYPTNAHLFLSKAERREAIDVVEAATVDHEALAQQRADERAARLQARHELQLSQQKELDAANERDAPKIRQLNDIAQAYTDIAAPFREKSGKQLRANGLAGSDSLELFIRRNASSELDTSNLSDKLRTYDGLTGLIRQSPDTYQSDITELIEQLDQVADRYASGLSDLQLEGTNRPTRLEHFIQEDIAWLQANWKCLRESIGSSRHRGSIDDVTLDRLEALLTALTQSEVEAGETETSQAETPDIIETNEPALIDESAPILENDIVPDAAEETRIIERPEELGQAPIVDEPLPEITVDEREGETEQPTRDILIADILPAPDTVNIDNALQPSMKELLEARQLDWEVLPPGEIETISREIVRQAQTENYNPTIDLKRLRILDNLRTLWGEDNCYYARGALSARRVIHDGGQDEADQYLMLILQEKDADGSVIAEHAIAESPIAGPNALYVFRQDVSEGLDWRDVMSLPKSYARDFGARNVKHALPRGETDLVGSMTEKVTALMSATPQEFKDLKFDGSRGFRVPKRVIQRATRS